MTGEITQYFGDLMLRYDEAGVIRALSQLVPLGIGSAGDTLIAAHVKKIREDRAREFFDEINKKGAVLTPAAVESEDFIHCFLITSKAALNTRRREKVRLFARLLTSSVSEKHPRDTDDYEQMLGIVDDLTYSESSALLILERYSGTERQASKNTLQWSLRFWPNVMSDVEREIGVPTEEFSSFMTAIARTGLYEPITGNYYDYEGGMGSLTSRFFRLKNYVQEETAL